MKMAKGVVFLALLVSISWWNCAQGLKDATTCDEKGLLFQLAEEHGQYECVKIEEEESKVYDFTAETTSASDARGNATDESFVVTFDEYKFADEHKLSLEKHLPVDKAWAWRDRQNEASKYTTDFGVITVPSDGKKDGLVEAIRGLRGVKGVFPDSSVRDLQARPGPSAVDSTYKDAVQDDLDSMDAPYSTAYKERLYFDPGRERVEHQTNSQYQPELIWNQGYTGKGIRVGVFDTGLNPAEKTRYIRNIKWRSNWTFQPVRTDGNGHGTASAGSIASIHPECSSAAPDVDIYTFKVFTDITESFSSWYLDAINFALLMKVHMVNVSIGGPDFLDHPFVEKFRELVANGVAVFAAMGNMGPLRGTTNSPADEIYIIGVGSHNFNFMISDYQSRGMSLQEKPYGYGRVTPGILAYADMVMALNNQEGCSKIMGTSTASPVALSAAALCASAIPEEERYRKVTPMSLKQMLIEGADRLDHFSMYDQGPGALNMLKSVEVAKAYEPRVTVFPSYIDLTSKEDSGFFWPHSAQPVYAKSMPLMLNFTIMNGMGVTGYFTDPPRWNPRNKLGNQVRFQFDYSNVLWPWSGYLGVYMHVEDAAAHSSGIAEGSITFNVSSPPFPGEKRGTKREQEVRIDIKLRVEPTPPRSKRVLWDDYHSLQYPYAYIPKDAAHETHTYDFQGDHPHTNYFNVFNELVANGYFVEVLSSSMTCFDASQYGLLVVIDPEMEFDQEEIDKLYTDVTKEGMGLLVLADWYDRHMIDKYTLWNDNYRATMHPAMGGCNVPALNRLLSNFEVAFSNATANGHLRLGPDKQLGVYDGAMIGRMPPNSVIFEIEPHNKKADKAPVLGMTKVGEGNLVIFSDSSSFDKDISHAKTGIKKMKGVFTDFVKYASEGETPTWIEEGSFHEGEYNFDFDNFAGDRPAYFRGNIGMYEFAIPDEHENLDSESMKLLSKPLQCFRNAPLSHQPDSSCCVERKGGSASIHHNLAALFEEEGGGAQSSEFRRRTAGPGEAMATGDGGVGEIEISDGLLQTFQEGRVFGPPDFGGQAPDQKEQTKEQPKVTSLDYHNSEPLLVSITDADAGIRLYNIDKGLHERTYYSGKHGVSSARFTHHLMAILYASTREDSTKKASENHAIRYHSLHDNAYIRYFQGHTEKVLGIEMSKVSDAFFSCSLDRTVKRWDLRAEAEQGSLDLKSGETKLDCLKPRVALDRDENVIAVGTEGGSIYLYSAQKMDGGPFHTIHSESIGLLRPPISCLKMSNKGDLVAVSIQGKILVYRIDVNTVKNVKENKATQRSLYTFETGIATDNVEFDFTSDDKYLLSGCGIGSVAVWSLDDGREVGKLKGGGVDIPSCLKWSPRHALFATGSSKLSLWLPGNDPVKAEPIAE
ncbi:subtilisin-like protein [Chloropicon primus]|uniref:Subtilisin-like protein n=2 Tax=Chloropicon primus TaxID=1764295 RepID=A0A5B8MMW7_9CHLO|nr:subtilisin-like protein [Chloropicon primus]UPQ99862.1 subtilisin-like protein [Chloropicon primus]|eukprot:QDZ20650.1 subtilisin-like protein [Chloropicon primus]